MGKEGVCMEEKKEIVSVIEQKAPLKIFITKEDRNDSNLALMSDFYEGYINQMSLTIRENVEIDTVRELPISDMEIINDVITSGEAYVKGTMTLLPDFDSVPADIRLKLKKKIYKIGQSKQVDGNLRPVIYDENNVRVKDITLKKVIEKPDNSDAVRNIGIQMQMKKIYSEIQAIRELQEYQIDRNRDAQIIQPFLEARQFLLDAETATGNECVELLIKGKDKLNSALAAVYLDVRTTSKHLQKNFKPHFPDLRKTKEKYIEILASDLQLATKIVGVQMQVLDYMGDANAQKYVMEQYNYTMAEVFEKRISDEGYTLAELIHDNISYSKDNLDCWYHFGNDMKEFLSKESENCIEKNCETYFVSVGEDADGE